MKGKIKIQIRKRFKKVKVYFIKLFKLAKKGIVRYYKIFKKSGRIYLIRNTVVATLVVALIISLLLNGFSVEAATYTWSQTNWGGGTSGGTYPAHPGDQTGWTKYESKDASTSIGSGDISVSSTS
ncbi:hypothetical protein K2P96_00595, partial [Patescibacteria group bacterium]|nr:hypothetical protein [Patescibacteria group bacterium]